MMRTSALREKAIRRIRKFAITEEEIDELIHAGEYVYDADMALASPMRRLST